MKKNWQVFVPGRCCAAAKLWVVFSEIGLHRYRKPSEPCLWDSPVSIFCWAVQLSVGMTQPKCLSWPVVWLQVCGVGKPGVAGVGTLAEPHTCLYLPLGIWCFPDLSALSLASPTNCI